MDTSIHTSIHPLIRVTCRDLVKGSGQVARLLETCCQFITGLTHLDKQLFTLRSSPTDTFEILVHLVCMLFYWRGGNWSSDSSLKIHAYTQHANSKQRGLSCLAVQTIISTHPRWPDLAAISESLRLFDLFL